jgi:hypothetical protein
MCRTIKCGATLVVRTIRNAPPFVYRHNTGRQWPASPALSLFFLFTDYMLLHSIVAIDLGSKLGANDS